MSVSWNVFLFKINYGTISKTYQEFQSSILNILMMIMEIQLKLLKSSTISVQMFFKMPQTFNVVSSQFTTKGFCPNACRKVNWLLHKSNIWRNCCQVTKFSCHEHVNRSRWNIPKFLNWSSSIIIVKPITKVFSLSIESFHFRSYAKLPKLPLCLKRAMNQTETIYIHKPNYTSTPNSLRNIRKTCFQTH